MKFNKLALVCAAACATFAGQASAQLSSNATNAAIVADANANSRVLYISGASAVQGGFNQIAQTLLQSGFARFQSSNAGDYRAVAGKLVTSAGTWAAGTNVIIINRAKGGSVWGVNPVARAEKIESLNVSSASCTTARSSRRLASGLRKAGADVRLEALEDVSHMTINRELGQDGTAQTALVEAFLAAS